MGAGSAPLPLCAVVPPSFHTGPLCAVPHLPSSHPTLSAPRSLFNNDGDEIFSFTGRYANGYRSGKGVYESKLTGVKMEGLFKQDVLIEGTFTSAHPPPKGASPLASYVGVGRDGVPGDGAGSTVKGEAYYHDGTHFVGEFVNGQRCGMGRAKPFDALKMVFFDGEWSQDMPHGSTGSAEWTDGSTYSGPWCQGKPHGDDGVLTNASGSTLSGTFVDGILVDGTVTHKKMPPQMGADGKAKPLSSPEKEPQLISFTGKQHHGTPGEAGAAEPTPGCAEYADGFKYTGGFLAGARCGQGRAERFLRLNMRSYEGACCVCARACACKLCGRALCALACVHRVPCSTPRPSLANQSQTMPGTWDKNLPHGEGAALFLDDGTYAGSWAGGKQHGKGSATWKDGSRYDGMWAGGKMHGVGLQKSMNGLTLEGIFKDGLLVEGVVRSPPSSPTNSKRAHGGTVYNGTLVNGRFHGQGTLAVLLPMASYPATPANAAAAPRTVYRGGFHDGAATGVGIITFASGAEYTGGVVDGVPSGEGKLSLPPSVTYFGGVVPGIWTPQWVGDAQSSAEPEYASYNPGDINVPAAQSALEAMGVLKLPIHGLSTTSLAIPGALSPAGAPHDAPLLFPDVGTSPWALTPSPGFQPDSPKCATPNDKLVRVSKLTVRVVASFWSAGSPSLAVAYETHGGVVFRGFLHPKGRLVGGWPHAAIGVLRMTKEKPGASGALRVMQETGCFHRGLLHSPHGLRSYMSKDGEERSKYGEWKEGKYSPTMAKWLTYARKRTFIVTAKDVLLQALDAVSRM